MSGPDEFQVIAQLFAPLAQSFPGALGLTDDAALLPPDALAETVVTVDAMVAGVHFLPDDPPDLVARKLVRVNLSDLAAKGALPFAVLLAAAFPHGTSQDWLERFAHGLGQDITEFGIALIGGDTVATPGPLTLSLTAMGKVAAGRAILRSGAQAGDMVWVSGTIGDGALGLRAARGQLSLPPEHIAALADRYRLPRPRVSLGPCLVGLASAGMDVSDGLVQDLGHLCRASHLAAIIDAAAVPLSPAARAALDLDQSLLATLLTGGDDYELLFAAPSSATAPLLELAERLGVPLTAIGRMEAGSGVTVHDASGRALSLGQGGWRHFSATISGAGA
ncbi:MAG: thiamine-phosphate kinase [Rhodospirillaceae bacterium]|nr:thiamine-phosphate kinase [Rhodospirillales bacterium]